VTSTGAAEWGRVIGHVDMDAFYASIEVRDDPSLEGKPVVVGGGSGSRGVVSAASYPARVYGIHSAMPMAEAVRRCPHLIRVPVNMPKYQDCSRQVMAIFRSFSPAIEPLSLDEAFLDLTGTARAQGAPEAVARAIRIAIQEQTRLSASVGIAPVKFVAKIASDLEKPGGLVVVPPGEIETFLHPLPISRLWGVGPRTRAVLEEMGIRTIGQIAATDPRKLAARFGIHGGHLHDLACGRDEREVIPSWDARSYSHEQTFARDQTDVELLESVLLDQSVRVARRLRQDQVSGVVVQLKLRYHDFRTLTRQHRLPGPTADPDRIYEMARGLFHVAWDGRPVRLIGVGVSGIQPKGVENYDLFRTPPVEERSRRLTETIDQIEDRFGRDKVVRAKVLQKKRVRGTGTPSDRGLID
jgi:DNA polymerase-4